MNAWLFIVVLWLATPPGAEAKEKSPSPPRDEAQPTAEDLLRALQRQRPPNDVIPPGSAGPGWDWKRPKPQLWPEGFSLVNKIGSLQQKGDKWWFQFESPGSDCPPAMQLLPNTNLEVLVRMVTGSPAPIRFTVSGEMTVFEGRNCLLVRTASRASPPPSVEAAPAASPTRIHADAPAGDVLSILREQSPDQPALSMPPESTTRPLRRSGVMPHALAEGTAVVQRVGRLVRAEGRWSLASDSQRADAAEQPIRILPNRVLEMTIADLHRNENAVFTVSGEVTLYFGENYLLPRVAMRRVDTGNLGP